MKRAQAVEISTIYILLHSTQRGREPQQYARTPPKREKSVFLVEKRESQPTAAEV